MIVVAGRFLDIFVRVWIVARMRRSVRITTAFEPARAGAEDVRIAYKLVAPENDRALVVEQTQSNEQERRVTRARGTS